VSLEDQIGAAKRLEEFVIEPTGKKKSGGKNDYIRRLIYSFTHRLLSFLVSSRGRA
jgi:hypothetical protein